MDAGTIQQVGAPPEVYTKPGNEFVASFIGEINMLNSDSEIIKKLNGPDSGKVGFRPEHVRATEDGIPAEVTHSSYLGSKNEVSLKTEQGIEIKAWLNSYHEVGESVRFTVDKEYLLNFPT